MKKILLAASLSAALFANPFEITPTITGVFPEGNLDLKNQLAMGLRVGYNFDHVLLTKIETGAEFTRAGYKAKPGAGDRHTLINRYFVNAIKEFDLSKKLAVYGLAGVGYEDIRTERYDNDDSMFGQYGVGLRYALTEALSLRGELRHGIKFDHGDNNLFATLGFTYRFGQTAETPVVEPTPVTPAPAPVYGDSDGDGVTDDKDLCPNTPKGQVVDAVGCVKVISLKVNFGFDKADITPEFDSQIQTVAAVLNSEKDYSVRLEGNTDSTGPAAYNMKLSEKRAKAVADRLVELGVAKSRITTEWFGATRPIADNKTPEGRAENRRVDTSFAK
ncbi:MAG: OmpA family protein [Campylobacteraceae bacterium]